MTTGLLLFGMFAIFLGAVLSMVLRRLGFDQKEAFTMFLLVAFAVIASTGILFLIAR